MKNYKKLLFGLLAILIIFSSSTSYAKNTNKKSKTSNSKKITSQDLKKHFNIEEQV